MKTRQGFVSNSSSSSFIVFGVHCERDEVVQLSMKDRAKFFAEFEDDFQFFVDEYDFDSDDEVQITIDNFDTIDGGDFLSYVMDNADDVSYRMPLPNGFEMNTGDESSEGAVIGYHVGSCDYGITELMSMAEMKDLLAKAENFKALGLGEPGIHNIYTGY